MNVHVVCCVVQGTNVKKKYKHYFEMTCYCIASLLKQGVRAKDITCIAENKKHCKTLKSKFGINVIHGPPIPKDISHLVSKNGGRKLFMYKPLCLSECLPDPVDKDTVMVMTDVDALFVKNPQSMECQTDVWSQQAFRYLRPSRASKMKKSYCNPRLDNQEELHGYFGSESQAYLFIKHKQKILPEYRLSGGLVFIKPQIYSDLIKVYREMCDDVIINEPKYCKGDQEILSSAVNILGLSYDLMGEDCSVQYAGGSKTKMSKDARKMGLN